MEKIYENNKKRFNCLQNNFRLINLIYEDLSNDLISLAKDKKLIKKKIAKIIKKNNFHSED